MTASIIKCKCPKCGATLIVDASADHSTCVWCGTSIPNVLAKESGIAPVAEGVPVERPRIDREKLDELNASGQTPSEATATETPAGPTGTTFSVNSLGKVILVVSLAPVLALATFALVSFLFFWMGVDPGSWVVNILAGLCTIGVVGFAIWTSIAPFVSSSPGIPERQATERPLTPIPSRHALSAFLIGVIWYWNNFISLIISSSDLEGNSLLWMALIVLLSEGALGVSRNGPRFFGATGLGILFGWITEVIFTLTFPHISPASHQLLPLEPVILAAFIIPPTILGNLAGKKLSLLQDKVPNAKQNNKLMLWLLTAAFILALVSPIAVPHR